MKKKPLTWVHYTAIGTGISATLVSLVAGGYFLGSFMDQQFDSYPLWTLAVIFSALAFGIAYLVFTLWKFLKTEDSGESSNGSYDDES